MLCLCIYIYYILYIYIIYIHIITYIDCIHFTWNTTENLSRPATDEMLTMCPLPRSRICGPKVATKCLETVRSLCITVSGMPSIPIRTFRMDFPCMYVRTYVCMYVRVCVCVCICMCMCMYVCIQIYVCIDICMYNIYIYMYIYVCVICNKIKIYNILNIKI